MAVLNNTMMQGTAAISDDESYQIEKSVRINNPDGAHFATEWGTDGDRRTFTVSIWFKKLLNNNLSCYLWGQYTGGMENQFFFTSAGEIQWYWNPHFYVKSSEKFMDTGAWYHLVAAFDSTESKDSDRVKLYINGRRLTLTPNTWPVLNAQADWNVANGSFGILGGTRVGRSGHWQFADVHNVDGLALAPSSFGSFDSTGVWNPKAFAMPAINANITWSSKGTWTHVVSGAAVAWASAGNGHITRGFNGVLDNANVYPNNQYYQDYQWTIPEADQPSLVSTARIWGVWSENYESYIHVHTDAGIASTYMNPSTSGWSTQQWQTLDVPKGSTKLQKLVIEQDTLSKCMDWGALELDGVLLVDGATDKTYDETVTAGGLGHTWSADLSTNDTMQDAGNAFDGNTGTRAQSVNAGNDKTLTWAPSPPVKFNSKLEVYCDQGTDVPKAEWNGNSVSPGLGAWVTVYTGRGEISASKPLVIDTKNGGQYATLKGVRLDDTLITDGAVYSKAVFGEKRFHLKFDNADEDNNLGYSQMMNTPTGAQPMYGPGADDSAKASLVLALPGYDKNDHSATIKGSGSNKAITFTGDAKVSTGQAKFYGKSLYCDGSGDKISAASNTDFATGTGAFTYELWFWWDDANANATLGATKDSNNDANGWSIDIIDGDDKIQMWTSSANNATPNGSVIKDRWNHFACVRDGSNTMKFYINGVEESSATVNNDFTTSSNGFAIGNVDGGNNFKGYYQDVRFYKGVAKYSSNFTPPVRNDWKVESIRAKKVGTVDYSADVTSSPAEHPTNTFDKIFAGEVVDGYGEYIKGSTSSVSHGNSFHITWTPSTAIPCTTSLFVGAYARDHCFNTIDIAVNDGSDIDVSTQQSGGSYTNRNNVFSGVTGNQITKIKYHGTYDNNNAGGEAPYIAYIEVDGTKLEFLAPKAIDSHVDSPTNYEPAVGSDATGGVTRGNYCTMNPLTNIDWGDGSWTINDGNLHVTTSGSDSRLAATMGASSGKWYWEVEEYAAGASGGVGINKEPNDYHATWNGTGDAIVYQSSGDKHLSAGVVTGTSSAYGSSFGKGDVIGVQWDADNGAIYFWKDGAIQNSGTAARTGMSGFYTPILISSSSGTGVDYHVNFGQRPFKYQNAGTNRPSADYKCLCSTNLPDTFSGEQINNPSKYFTVNNWIGQGVAQTFNTGFGPDLVWYKERTSTSSHGVVDRLRGSTDAMEVHYPDRTDTPVTASSTTSVTSLGSSGFTIGSTDNSINAVGDKYISWSWDAGTAASGANTDGSVNIADGDQWVNATAGFSITKYTGDHPNSITFGHGLGVKPDFCLFKNITGGAENWLVYHKDVTAEKAMYFNTNALPVDGSYWYDDTEPTNTIFTLGNSTQANQDTKVHICYAWAAIPGYSAFGQYKATNIDNGPFVNLGFQPRWIMFKNLSATWDWMIHDTTINASNISGQHLIASRNNAVANWDVLDIVSNGFKMIKGNSEQWNYSTGGSEDDYIYCAFAEYPFKTARAR